MKRAVTAIWAVLSIALLLAGCQATPEEPVVVQKDMEQMIEKGMEESDEAGSPPPPSGLSYAELCAHYGVPERFQADIDEQGVKVHADVSIDLPGTTSLPMARVEAAKFSQEQVYTLFKTLCGNTQMYIMPEMPDKARYQEEILKCQALLTSATDDEAIRSINSNLDYLRQQYEIAPDHIEVVPSDGTLQTRDVEHDNTEAGSGIQTYLKAASDPNDIQVFYTSDTLPHAMKFEVYNDIDYLDTSIYSYVDEQGNTQNIAPSSGSRIEFMREGSGTELGRQGTKLADVTALSLSGGPAENCLLTITPLQARETVERLMADAGLDDMVIDHVELYTSKEEPWSGDDPDGKMEMMEQMGVPDQSNQPERQAYVFRLLRVVNGVPVESDHDSSMTSIEQMSYGKEWMYEKLTIAVDGAGIANLFWTGPLSVTEMLIEDTSIKPWSDIQGVFEKMMPIRYGTYTDLYSDVRVDVTHTRLSLQRIMERDSFTTGLLVPVWNFYGTMTAMNGEDVLEVVDDGYFPLLSVNAIDGSVIDVLQGY